MSGGRITLEPRRNSRPSRKGERLGKRVPLDLRLIFPTKLKAIGVQTSNKDGKGCYEIDGWALGGMQFGVLVLVLFVVGAGQGAACVLARVLFPQRVDSKKEFLGRGRLFASSGQIGAAQGAVSGVLEVLGFSAPFATQWVLVGVLVFGSPLAREEDEQKLYEARKLRDAWLSGRHPFAYDF